MAQAKKDTTIKVTLELSEAEAKVIKELTGYVIGGGYRRALTGDIYDALDRAGIECDGNPFTSIPSLKKE